MRKLICFMASLVLFFPLAFGTDYEQSDYYSASYSRLSYIKGDVYVQRGQDLGYEEAVVNLPVVEGDRLGTREGRTEIQLGRGNFVRVDHDTMVDFETLPKRGNDLISLNLLSGNIYLRVGYLEFEKGIEVHTPDASFYVLDEGLFRLEVLEDQETRLYVVEGEMEAAGEEGSLALQRGESLIAERGFFRSGDNRTAGYAESFAEWNRTRDGFYHRGVSRRYLPSELYDFEAELDYYGRWVYEASYGYVWVPHVVHSTWRPYHHGRWVWYPIIGWTWVSYNPWGWCVSHYGRWHWRLGLGWYWIPRRAWSPAWVYWYSGYNYVGWCPLSYYGHPVVIINNRFYGRYYHANYPVHSRALTVIHRNQLQSRHISRVALSRNEVSRVGKISLSSHQPAVKYRVDRSSAAAFKARTVMGRASSRQVKKRYAAGSSGAALQRASPAARSSKTRFRDSRSGITTRDSTVKYRSSSRDGAQSERTETQLRSRSDISVDRSTSSRIRKYTSRTKPSSLSRSRSDRRSVASSKSEIKLINVDPRTPREMIKRYPSRSSSSRDASYPKSSRGRVEKDSSSSRSSSRTRIQRYSSSRSSRNDGRQTSEKYSVRRSSTPIKRFTSRLTSPSSSRSRSDRSQDRRSVRSYSSGYSEARPPSRSRVSSSKYSSSKSYRSAQGKRSSASRSRISSSRSSSSRRSSRAFSSRGSSSSRSSRSAVRSSSSRSRSSSASRSGRSSRSSSSSRSRSRKR